MQEAFLKPPRKDPFEPLPLAVKALDPQVAATRYLVYSSPQEHKMVNAESADEAARLSGIVKPFRIVREDALRKLMLDKSMFG